MGRDHALGGRESRWGSQRFRRGGLRTTSNPGRTKTAAGARGRKPGADDGQWKRRVRIVSGRQCSKTRNAVGEGNHVVPNLAGKPGTLPIDVAPGSGGAYPG